MSLSTRQKEHIVTLFALNQEKYLQSQLQTECVLKEQKLLGNVLDIQLDLTVYYHDLLEQFYSVQLVNVMNNIAYIMSLGPILNVLKIIKICTQKYQKIFYF